MIELSILIPARNEMFLNRTIQNILEHSRADTEIIAVLDGGWPPEPVEQHPRVNVVYLPEPIGQRAATNIAAKLAQGEYLMKCDAHCAFDEGFDRILLEDITPDVTMVPIMRNLHAFDWVCGDCDWRDYQGPTPESCPKCGSQNVERDIIWIGKTSPQSTAYRVTPDLEFRYWGEYKRQQHGDLVETMSLQGSCWVVHRDRYFGLNICDESLGSWGGQGAEVALKTWLSGGRVLVNKKTWYAHLFRTQGGDFSFPYPNPGNEQKAAKDRLRDVFLGDNWEHATRPLSWLLDRFAPVPEWDYQLPVRRDFKWKPTPRKAILYYTCNTHAPEIDEACRAQLLKSGLPITSVSLNKPLNFGSTQITLEGERGPEMMHMQILAGLEACDTDFVFLCENDVLYHPSHFAFTPKRTDVFYYNTNVWKLHMDGLATWTDNLQQVSGLCASRSLLLEYYRMRVAQIAKDGFDRHYEPRGKRFWGKQRGGKYGEQNWQSEMPNVDIRHNGTFTKSKRSPDEFRNPQYAKGWRTADEIPGWGSTAQILEMIK